MHGPGHETRTVEGAGVPLAVHERGAGPAVVLVHGMADDHAAWRTTAGVLVEAGLRVVVYDRRGYGRSGATEPFDRTSIHEQTEDLAAVIGALAAAPAVVVGADIAALAVIDLARRHAGLLRAAVLIEPPAFALVPVANEPLAAERQALEAALREGGARAGVAAWLALRGVDDEARLARAQRDAAAFFADYGGQTTLELTRRNLRDLDVPLAVALGPDPPAHVRAAAAALVALVPGARTIETDGLVTELRALTGAG